MRYIVHDFKVYVPGITRIQPFFGGKTPDLVDFAAFGYVRSISPYPQFGQLTDHVNGMAWYDRMEATLS